MLTTASRLSLVTLILAQAACGGALTEPFTPPESGGQPWIEVTSKHIVLRTDLSPSDARDTCAEFERIYMMFEDIAFPYKEKPRTQTSIVLFRREAEYKIIGPRNTIGYFHRALAVDDYFEPMAVFYGDLTARTRLTFQHELTHRFIDFYFPNAPVWLDEGMADYYSTMQIDGDKVVLGRDLPNRFFRGGLTWSFDSSPMWTSISHVPIGSARPVHELVAMEKGDFYAARGETGSPSEEEQSQKQQTANYASAWALVHLLMNGPESHQHLFNGYLVKLAAGADPYASWKEASDGQEQILQNDYQAWLAPIDRIIKKAPYELPAAPEVSDRVMAPADVHVLWASIRPWSSDPHRAKARAELEAAIRLDPRKVSARVWLAQLDEAEGSLENAEKNLREAMAAAPEDANATYSLFRLLVRQASRSGSSSGDDRWKRTDELLPKVLAVATSARVQNGAARYLGLRARTDEGLPHALRAVRADPSCWQCFDTLALLLAQKGVYAKAKEAQTIAVSLIPEGVSSKGPVARLRQYEKEVSSAKPQ